MAATAQGHVVAAPCHGVTSRHSSDVDHDGFGLGYDENRTTSFHPGYRRS